MGLHLLRGLVRFHRDGTFTLGCYVNVEDDMFTLRMTRLRRGWRVFFRMVRLHWGLYLDVVKIVRLRWVVHLRRGSCVYVGMVRLDWDGAFT